MSRGSTRNLRTRLPREVILSALRDTRPVASDGTHQFFGIPDALPGLPRAIEQGWTAYRSTLELPAHADAADTITVKPAAVGAPELREIAITPRISLAH